MEPIRSDVSNMFIISSRESKVSFLGAVSESARQIALNRGLNRGHLSGQTTLYRRLK
jgi:hypothetical protein